MKNWLLVPVVVVLLFSCARPEPPAWPRIDREARPWTRWWWHGSALTREGITAELEAYRRAGIGGVEITPIYGVRGYEDSFVPYLSDRWMELLVFTLAEAERLDLGVDMATGTGWPFGGPWAGEQYACRNVFHTIYSLAGGQSLREKVVFRQPPYLRAVGNQIYEVQDVPAAEATRNQGTRKEPLLRLDPKSIRIEDLVQPVERNRNLQQLALDQVQFERTIPLIALVAYNEHGEAVQLTELVQQDGTLDWVAPDGNWKLYALFQGWHGKMVERAGPGGEGNVIDHFNREALDHYLERFDRAFAGKDLSPLRGFFNDSYEVDDARGAADWTNNLLNEFKVRRGYDLTDHLPSLLATDSSDKDRRILYDYRVTIGELLLENFTQPWSAWARSKDAITRNQAHGSPANILDLYAAVDIPEIEGTDPLRIRMATSAANVMGKKLVSSESATWLDEHFQSDLGEIKSAVDVFLANGVNHIFYHGTSYSPPGEPWPGWLFYAAVHLNPRNSQWNDVDILNNYVARCQSILQNTKPTNDVLLYYPVADPMSQFGPERIEHFDGIGRQFAGSSFEQAALLLREKRFGFDFISDRQLQQTKFEDGRLISPGGAAYKTVVVPYCDYLPIETLRHLVRLMEEGGHLLFSEKIAGSYAGYVQGTDRQQEFDSLLSRVRKGSTAFAGRAIVAPIDENSLYRTPARPQVSTTDPALRISFTRRGHNGTVYYLVTNDGDDFTSSLTFDAAGRSVIAFDPMNGDIRRLSMRGEPNRTVAVVELNHRQTLIVAVSPERHASIPEWSYSEFSGDAVPVTSPWEIRFESGGPSLPPSVATDTTGSWTVYGEAYATFSGTAVYRTTFTLPGVGADGWMLDLGDVRSSARVFLNGQEIAAMIAPPFRVKIEQPMAQKTNVLEVHVSNGMANRIADLEKRGVFWKKFYNINFPARLPENRKDGQFSASEWIPEPSGLLGPVSWRLLRKRTADDLSQLPAPGR